MSSLLYTNDTVKQFLSTTKLCCHHLLFLPAANENAMTGTDATEATNGVGWKWRRKFGPTDIVDVEKVMVGECEHERYL